MNTKEQKTKVSYYVEYLNAKDNFKQTKKNFKTYASALKFLENNFEYFSVDMIKIKFN